jgi:hypothetical protein
MNRTGIAMTTPASGPAIPTSKSTRLFFGTPRIAIKAPNVPSGLINGAGKKNGNVAGTL